MTNDPSSERMQSLAFHDRLIAANPENSQDMEVVQKVLRQMIVNKFKNRDPNIYFVDTEAHSIDQLGEKNIHEIPPKGVPTLLQAIVDRASMSWLPGIEVVVGDRPTDQGNWNGKSAGYDHITVILAPDKLSRKSSLDSSIEQRRGFYITLKNAADGEMPNIDNDLWNRSGTEDYPSTNIESLRKVTQELIKAKASGSNKLPFSATINFFQLPFKIRQEEIW